MAIPFTQFLIPDGRTREVSIARSKEVERKAQQILAAGFVFECEHLSTGDVSFTITDGAKGDVAVEICPNGPAVPEAVDRLVGDFDLEVNRRSSNS